MRKLLISLLVLVAGFATAADIKGEVLTISGPWIGADQDHFEAVLDAFREKTGADVRYVGSDSFEQDIVVNLEAGSPPNVAIFPQPGLAADMAKKGYLTPLGDDVDAFLRENYAAGDSWADLSTFPGKDGKDSLYIFPYKADLKSLVWYVPDNFEDYGYEVPTTMEELKALTEQMVKDGNTPWAIGLGSGAATGWPATDWVEDLVLRTQPADVYDGWVKNEVKFDDSRIIEAINEFGWFAKNDDFVVGGAAAVTTTDFRDSPKQLFTSPPQAFMHRMASFVTSFFPEGTELGVDADFFYFPSYASKDLGNPVLGAGTLFGITKDSPAAEEFIKFLETPEAHEVWMAREGFLTPLKTVDTSKFSSPIIKKMNDIILNATTFRFDGSDMMPGAIGSGAFWTGMVDFVGGDSAEDAAGKIQKAWDNIQ